MMSGFVRRLPIRHKLVLMIMATSIVVLLLASGGYIVTDYYESRDDLRRELTAQAEIIVQNSTAALQFLDPAAADETLQTLAQNRHIRSACLYDARGALFAQFSSATSIPCATAPGPDGYQFSSDGLLLVASATVKDKRAGTLFLRSDLKVLQDRLRVQFMIVALLLILTTGVALFMSSRLQSLVSEPVTALARTASEVSARGDYGIRAARTTDDELGVLVDAFNRMLERIQLREGELSAANEELRKEIADRRRAEQERAELLVREREANRLKDEFLATLSHELRTPLNAILGWTKLMRSGAVPAVGIDRALEKIERNAQVQSRLVEDLLEVSRIASGKLRLEVRSLRSRGADHDRDRLDSPGRRSAGRGHRSDVRGARVSDRGRSGPAPAGDLEPALERGQVHAVGRRGDGAASPGRRRRRAVGLRHRHRHRTGLPPERVRHVPAGRRLEHAGPRRARTRTLDRQATWSRCTAATSASRATA